MIRNTLFACVALGLYTASAFAQDEVSYDDRWYIAPYLGVVFTDDKRNTASAPILGISFGRFLTHNFSLEADINRFDADLDLNGRNDGSWQVTGYGLTGRLFLNDYALRPYVLLGAGTQRSDRDRTAFVPAFVSRSSNGFDFKTGFGVQSTYSDRVSGRFEAVYRYMQDPESLPREDDFSDLIANFGLTIALGERSSVAMVSPEAEALGEPSAPMAEEEEAPAAAPAPEPVAHEDMQEVIDLRGVNFDFDKCNLRSDAVTILNNAVDVLKTNELNVSVQGHTDSVGSDAYNQKLSECRAKVVYDYLSGHGVESKLRGSVGFGESKPIDTNETVEGRANNRRTELVRDN